MSLEDNFECVIGSDEVGYGAGAGPLLVCAVLAPSDWNLKGLNDSKKMTPSSRQVMYDKIQEQAPFIKWFFAWRSASEIDAQGVGRARFYSFLEVMKAAWVIRPDATAIVDGNLNFKDSRVKSIPKADGIIPSVMAASILAKVERDRWMQTEADCLYPEYGFVKHVGYLTPEHLKALQEHGPCKIHRFSYAPVARSVKL